MLLSLSLLLIIAFTWVFQELLALEEHIGNVSTGLTEETILKHLKQKPHVVEMGQPVEPCSVCQVIQIRSCHS